MSTAASLIVLKYTLSYCGIRCRALRAYKLRTAEDYLLYNCKLNYLQ
jgi:hypothetical protein